MGSSDASSNALTKTHRKVTLLISLHLL